MSRAAGRTGRALLDHAGRDPRAQPTGARLRVNPQKPRVSESRDLFIVRLYTGRSGRYPSVEEAEAYPSTERELAIARHARRRTVAGAPEQVRDRLQALGAEYGVDEFVIATITHEPKARHRSYELLAEVFSA